MTDAGSARFAPSPYATIWRQPRATLRAVLENRHEPLLPLAIAGGIADVFTRAFARAPHGALPTGQFWAFALFGGALWGGLWLYSATFAFHLVGKWQGGRAPFQSILTMIAWSRLPLAVSLLWWIPATTLFGTDLFTVGARTAPNALTGLLLFTGALIIIGSIVWSWFLIVRGIQVAQDFSLPQALGSIALVFGLTVAVAMVVVFVLLLIPR